MHTDVAIVGGGPAGLQAALTLGRIHRTAVVLDDGTYRNATVTHMHNVLTNDGTPPADFRATAHGSSRHTTRSPCCRRGSTTLSRRATTFRLRARRRLPADR